MNNLESDQLSTHYDASRKSFLFYRISIGGSMLLLMTVLGINLYFLNTNEQTTTQSRASNNEAPALPSLPPGCEYKNSTTGYVVSCATPTPEPSLSNTTPTLPPQCRYESISEKEYILRCDTSASASATSYPSQMPIK